VAANPVMFKNIAEQAVNELNPLSPIHVI